MKRTALAPALLALALAFAGCETTAEKSARLERKALARAATSSALADRGLSISRQSAFVKVLSTTVVHDSEGIAVAVKLRNESATAQSEVPLAITVRSSDGTVLYTNSAPGLAPSLTSVPLIAAHTTLTWIDDQVQSEGTPTTVTAKVGEGRKAGTGVGAPPPIAVSGNIVGREVKGQAMNNSDVVQSELVVYATVSRAGKIVAAGRSVVTHLAGGASSPFQIFLIGGQAEGGRLELSAGGGAA